jgi:hypothetical protein
LADKAVRPVVARELSDCRRSEIDHCSLSHSKKRTFAASARVATSDLVETSAGGLRATIYSENVDGAVQLDRCYSLAVGRDAALDVDRERRATLLHA